MAQDEHTINNSLEIKSGQSILEALGDYDNRIVSIKTTTDGFEFTEECDSYFSRVLSLEQFDEFIKNLQELREKHVTTR